MTQGPAARLTSVSDYKWLVATEAQAAQRPHVLPLLDSVLTGKPNRRLKDKLDVKLKDKREDKPKGKMKEADKCKLKGVLMQLYAASSYFLCNYDVTSIRRDDNDQLKDKLNSNLCSQLQDRRAFQD